MCVHVCLLSQVGIFKMSCYLIEVLVAHIADVLKVTELYILKWSFHLSAFHLNEEDIF